MTAAWLRDFLADDRLATSSPVVVKGEKTGEIEESQHFIRESQVMSELPDPKESTISTCATETVAVQ